MKQCCFLLVAAMAGIVIAESPYVDNLDVRQAADRTVTISYDLKNDNAIVTLDVLKDGLSIGGTNLWCLVGDVNRVVNVGDNKEIKWFPDGAGQIFDLHADELDFQLTAHPVDDPPLYMVVDLNTNNVDRKAQIRYYPNEAFLPGGLLGNLDYRTSSIVMRRMYAKNVSWQMGYLSGEESITYPDTKSPEHTVSLENDYYIGVFEVTQAQYFHFSREARAASLRFEGDWAMRPIESVSFEKMRGDSSSYYPNPPGAATPLGKLRSLTGLSFDLPSEAQWEYAAHSGVYTKNTWNTGVAFSGGLWGSSNIPARNYYNAGQFSGDASMPWGEIGATNCSAIVGSYPPSLWGLYDMHANVAEWCLDYWVEEFNTNCEG